jgi:hypothetical protein
VNDQHIAFISAVHSSEGMHPTQTEASNPTLDVVPSAALVRRVGRECLEDLRRTVGAMGMGFLVAYACLTDVVADIAIWMPFIAFPIVLATACYIPGLCTRCVNRPQSDWPGGRKGEGCFACPAHC